MDGSTDSQTPDDLAAALAQTVSEADIDWILCVELNGNPAFRHWLARELGAEATCHLGTWRSVADPRLGESDLIWFMANPGKQPRMILVENKINAQAQPEQYERYHCGASNTWPRDSAIPIEPCWWPLETTASGISTLRRSSTRRCASSPLTCRQTRRSARFNTRSRSSYLQSFRRSISPNPDRVLNIGSLGTTETSSSNTRCSGVVGRSTAPSSTSSSRVLLASSNHSRMRMERARASSQQGNPLRFESRSRSCIRRSSMQRPREGRSSNGHACSRGGERDGPRQAEHRRATRCVQANRGPHCRASFSVSGLESTIHFTDSLSSSVYSATTQMKDCTSMKSRAPRL